MYNPNKPAPPEKFNQEQPESERLDSLMRKRYGKLLGGRWEADLPGIESISIIKPESGASLHVLLYSKDFSGHRDFSLTKNGLYGSMPFVLKKMGLTKEMIEARAVEILDQVGPADIWYDIPEKIFSEKDPGSERGPGAGERKKILNDPRRIEILIKQEDFLFAFLSENGYQGFVFKNFIVLEHEARENAAFFIDFDEEMSEEEIDAAKTMTGRDKIIEKYWTKYRGKSKMSIWSLPEGDRMKHKPIDNWIRQMVDKLNERNPLPNRNIYSEEEKK